MVEFKVDSVKFIKALSGAISCVSTDSTHGSLVGVNFNINGDTIEVVGTDGHKLIRRALTITDIDGSIENSITLEVSKLLVLINAFKKDLKAKNYNDTFTIEIHSNSNSNSGLDSTFTINGVSFVVINDVYPDIEKGVTTPYDTFNVIKIPVKRLTELVSAYKKIAPKTTNLISLHGANNGLSINVTNNNLGIDGSAFLCNIDIDIDTEFSVGINVDFLQNMLKQLKQKYIDFVDIKLQKVDNGSNIIRPIFITTNIGHDRDINLLMPLKIM